MRNFFRVLCASIIIFSCTDPNIIGLEVQPPSDAIIIDSKSDLIQFNMFTESTDSIRTDEASNLVLGSIANDPNFLYSDADFCTQILLQQNSNDLGTNPIVDSVILSYTYSGYYGVLEDFTTLEVSELSERIYKDSMYYSNSEIINSPINLVESHTLNTSEQNPFLKIELSGSLGQKILDLGNDLLIDNETFLENFYGFAISSESFNTMLYLNPDGSNSVLKIYYSNDESGSDTLSLDFDLGGNAARVNFFNSKPLSNLNQNLEQIYVQSMAGYNGKITLDNLSILNDTLEGKAINKVTLSLPVFEDQSYPYYPAHDRLYLVRVNELGNDIFLTDYTIEGEVHFGGHLDTLSIPKKYTFNISRYFHRLLKNENGYTNQLRLLPAGAAVNANRTIIDQSGVSIHIIYSKL